MIKSLAQIPSTPFPEGFQGLGPLGGETSPGIWSLFTEVSASEKFERIFSVSIGVMTVIGSLWFLVQIFIGAVQWVGAGSEKQALQEARKRILQSIMGLLVIAMSYGLILLIGSIFGLRDILYPSRLIIKLLFP